MRRIVIFIIIIFLAGCSQGGDLTQPSENPGYPSFEYTVDSESSNGHSFLYQGELHLDTTSMTASINTDRNANAHYNIQSFLPPPTVQIVMYDPLTGIMDIDVTISNPYSITGYDLRLIVFNDDNGIRLVNPDAHTSLYDLPGGSIINPFIAFAKEQENRRFDQNSQCTETCQFYLPGTGGNVRIAIDVSWPGNCLEPYAIENFSHEKFYEVLGSYANFSVDVMDWQEDVDKVVLYCPPVFGASLKNFNHVDGSRWESEFVNTSGVPTGKYFGYVAAESGNSGSLALYREVKVTVSPASSIGCPYDYNSDIDHAEIIALDATISGCVDVEDEDWFVFYCPPNGIQLGTIDLQTFGGVASLNLYGMEPGDQAPGTLISTDLNILLEDSAYSCYFIHLAGIEMMVNYVLELGITPKLTSVACEIYVSTTDGTPSGTWPVWETPDPDEELTPAHLANMLTWCNNFWNQYGYNLVWDGSVTIMGNQYYNLQSGEDEAMHGSYGSGSGKLSLYFVNSIENVETAYCKVWSGMATHNVDNVFSVYSPNIWYWQEVVAHEHGHGIAYFQDQYLFDMLGLDCGDDGSLPPQYAPFLYSDADACYAGNLMWYGMGWSWDQYDITFMQEGFLNWFHLVNPDNFPWY